MRYEITKITFGEKVRAMTREQFFERFGPIFPYVDLTAYADDMGLISEPVADEAPAAMPTAAEGEDVPGIAQAEEPAAKPKGRRKKIPTE